jgi:hypothetical protein
MNKKSIHPIKFLSTAQFGWGKTIRTSEYRGNLKSHS